MPLVQIFDSYIMYEGPDGVIIVDQHSAHERVLYEAVMLQLRGAGAPAQRLLLPLTLELTDEELDAFEAHGEELRRVGFEAEPFGGRTVVVHAVPTPHPRFDAGACFREMVADLARGRFGGWANRLERFAATYACRAAVKAGERLGPAGDARAAAAPLRHRSAAARRARTRHDRAAPARGVGAPIWPAVGFRCWSAPPRSARPPWRSRSRRTGRWRSSPPTPVRSIAGSISAPPSPTERSEPGCRITASIWSIPVRGTAPVTSPATGSAGSMRSAGADKLPVVVGGTGLYVRALAEGLFAEPPLDSG